MEENVRRSKLGIRIADIPPSARPRERLEKLGLAALSEVELIALVIRSGKVGESALATAARLLSERGDLRSLSKARLEEVSTLSGIGIAKATSLLAAFELGRRAALDEPDDNAIHTPEDLMNSAYGYISDTTREQLLTIILGPGNRLIRIVPISFGSAEACIVPIREILSAVLRNDGVSFALVHNHPSGELRPSAEDLVSTRSVEEAAERAGIRFLDHMIVSDSRWLSLRQSGYLGEPHIDSMESPVERT